MSRNHDSNMPIAQMDIKSPPLNQESLYISNDREFEIVGWTWSCDAEGNYNFISQEVETVLGIPPQQFIGKPLSSYKLSNQSAIELENAFLNDQLPIEIPVIYQDEHGSLHPAKLYALRSNGNGVGAGEHNWYGFTTLQQMEGRLDIDTNNKFNGQDQAIPLLATLVGGIDGHQNKKDDKEEIPLKPKKSDLLIRVITQFIDFACKTTELESLFQMTVDLLAENMKLYFSSIYLIDFDHDEAVLKFYSGEADVKIHQNEIQYAVGSDNLIGLVASTGVERIIKDVSTEPLYLPQEKLPLTKSEVCLPIFIENTILGVIALHKILVDDFTIEEIETAKILSRQLSIILKYHQSHQSTLLMQDTREAESLMSEIMDVINNNFHSILSSIIGYTRVILKEVDGPITELQRADLMEINKKGHQLLNLLNNVIDYSNLEAGNFDLSLENNVNIEDIFHNVISFCNELLGDNPVHLKTVIEPDIPNLRMDPVKIQQVILNLVMNTIDNTHEEEVVLSARQNTIPNGDSYLVIEVYDTDFDTSDHVHEKEYNPIYKANTSNKMSNTVALELNTSQELIKMHGGELGFYYKVNKGSRYYFNLPVEENSH